MIVILEAFQIFFILLFAVVLHEYAHGWVASKRGDMTAKFAGRLTLNPIKHVDPVGTIVVPLVLRLLNLPVIGWAKPVPVNFAALHNPKRDMIWVALAGPAVNIVLALSLSLLLRVSLPHFLYETFNLAIMINLLLAMFNMIPIPPLDGSRVIMGVLPNALARQYARLEPFGIVIVFILLNFGLLNFVWFLVVFAAAILGVDFSVFGFKN